MDEVIESEDDNDLTPFGDIASSKPPKAADDDASDNPNVPIWSNIDPDEWRLEVERVSNRLKLQGDPTGGDHREWRSHLEQTKTFKGSIEKLLPEGELRLRKIADDLSKTLERISSQEKKINQSMGEITGNYRSQANDLNSRKTLYKQLNEKVANLSNQLSEINSRLEEIQDKIDHQGRMVTDTSPLMGIKESLRVLKLESKDMELRGAVLSHSLFQAKLKEKSRGDI
jgi:estrogen-related receptor beta like 1